MCPGLATPEGLDARLGHVEAEAERTRDRLHGAEGQIAALRILAEVGTEQRNEMIASVAELKADLRSGFHERDTEWDRAFKDQRESMGRTLRWGVGIAATISASFGALVVQLIHTTGG